MLIRKKNNESGVILILSIFVLSVAFVISLSFAAVFLKELQLSRAIVNSTVAFYAADAGIEHALYTDRKAGGLGVGGPFTGDSPLVNTATYEYTVTGTTPDRVVNSTGLFGGVKRTLEARY